MATPTATRNQLSKSRSSTRTARAAAKAVETHTTALTLPGIGSMQLPSKGSLAYFGAIAGLTALGMIEWPVAVVVGVGHLLAQQHGNAVLEEFGEGMEDA